MMPSRQSYPLITSVLVALLCVLLVAPHVTAITITRDAPAKAVETSDVTLTFNLRDAQPAERVVIDEQVPEGAVLQDWHIDGAVVVPVQQEGRSITWDITMTEATAMLTYTVRMPTGSVAPFDAVWASSTGGYGHLASSTRIVAIPAAAAVPLAEESPAPVSTLPPRSRLVSLLLVAIIAASVALVYVVETSQRHVSSARFGHHTVRFVTHHAGRARRVVTAAFAAGFTHLSAVVRRRSPVAAERPATDVPVERAAAYAAERYALPDDAAQLGAAIGRTVHAAGDGQHHEVWQSPIFR